MRKPTIIILAVLVIAALLCTAAFAEVKTIASPEGALSTGWNLIAFPGVPVDGNSTPGQPPAILDEFSQSDGAGLDARSLIRWTPSAQGLLQFDKYNPSDFGNLLANDGYCIKLGLIDPKQISFQGVDTDGKDVYISLPRAGWTLIGHPFSNPSPDTQPGAPYYTGTPYSWSRVKVTDGTVTKSLRDASQHGAGWIQSVAYWYDGGTSRMVTVGLPEDQPAEESLIAWHGYWVKSLKDNLALIFESSP